MRCSEKQLGNCQQSWHCSC